MQHPFGGLALMVLALLVEATLYVIRTTARPTLHIEQAKASTRRRMEAQVAEQRKSFAVEGVGEFVDRAAAEDELAGSADGKKDQ